MFGIDAAIRQNGCFQQRRDLMALGFSDFQIRRALRAGRIIRVRQGHYSVPDALPEAIQAVRIGGRLTGLSALKTYGLWVPNTDALHVAVPSDARALRSATDKRVRFASLTRGQQRPYSISWTDDASRSRHPCPWRVSLVEALLHVVCASDRETAIVCLDSALNMQTRHETGRGHELGITLAQLDEIFARAPARVQSWRAEVDGRAQSGGETLFRLKCADAGIRFVPQAYVPGVGHHDGQIGLHTFVELNSVAHHVTVAQFEEDHRRQAQSTLWGNRVLNFTTKQATEDWDLCLDVMRQALAEDAALSKSTDVWRGSPPDRAGTRRVAKNFRRFESECGRDWDGAGIRAEAGTTEAGTTEAGTTAVRGTAVRGTAVRGMEARGTEAKGTVVTGTVAVMGRAEASTVRQSSRARNRRRPKPVQ